MHLDEAARFIATCTGLLGMSSVANLFLHGNSWKRFRHSSAITLGSWLVLCIGICIFMLVPMPAKIALILYGLLGCWNVLRCYITPTNRIILYSYVALLLITLPHFLLYNGLGSPDDIQLLSAVFIGAMWAEATAFYATSPLAAKYRPFTRNVSHRSMLIVSHCIGAFGGVVCIRLILMPEIPFWIGVPIGLGSAYGALWIMYVKQILASDTNTARSRSLFHTYTIDRLALLSCTAAVVYWSSYLFI
jgi:hypothetical protein